MVLKVKTLTQAFWSIIRSQTKDEITRTLLVLQSFYALYTVYPEARHYFNHPRISTEDKMKRIEQLIEIRGHPCRESRNFLEFLLKASQLHRLASVLPLLHEWRNFEFGIASIKASSAEPLDDDQREFLKKRVQECFGSKEVELHESVDVNLLGGIVLRMNGDVLDASAKKKLRTLRNALISS